MEKKDWDQAVSLLLTWFDENKRKLPWREQPTPYHVFVSEIMLQQTRVETVKPYYERFLKMLPDVHALSAAKEETLLKLWEGLGYYNRVRNMQKAALQVVEEYDGRIPDSYNELLKLKGIGPYTAGAIASIAYGKQEPAVDGNVLRVLMRFFSDESDIAKQSVKDSVSRMLREWMPQERCGDFNQALMELGAVVCLPNGVPLCEECPLVQLCLARKQGKVDCLPVKSGKIARKIEKKTILIIRDDEKTAVCKRSGKGLLAGMYEFPNAEGYLSPDEALSYVKEKGFAPLRITEIEPSKHIFSHKEWHMKAYVIKVEPVGCQKGFLFASAKDAQDKYPIPSAFAAYAKYLSIKIGNDRFQEE